MADAMGRATTLLVQGEDGVFTIFSLAHWLWGALFHFGWIVLELGDAWVSLLIISTAAMLFEIAEASDFVGKWVWGRTLGFHSGLKFRPDSLTNAFSDALFSNLGFLVVQLTEVLTESASAARRGMAIGCGAVGLLFLVLFFARQTALGRALERPTQTSPVVSVVPKDRQWFKF